MPIAKLFTIGRSQAVRLPAEFRFDTDKVYIRRDLATGDVVLSRRSGNWDEFFARADAAGVPENFLVEREQATSEHRDRFDEDR